MTIDDSMIIDDHIQSLSYSIIDDSMITNFQSLKKSNAIYLQMQWS